MLVYHVKIKKVRRLRFEGKYSWEVEATNENGQYVSIYQRTKHPTSAYAYSIKTSKKRALKAILDIDTHQDEFKIVFDERGTVEEMKQKLT